MLSVIITYVDTKLLYAMPMCSSSMWLWPGHSTVRTNSNITVASISNRVHNVTTIKYMGAHVVKTRAMELAMGVRTEPSMSSQGFVHALDI